MRTHQILTARGVVRAPRPLLRRLLLELAGGRSSGSRAADYAALDTRINALADEVRHLEAALEGLQDAVHRRSQLDDRRNDELLRRTEQHPGAADMSDERPL